MKSPAVEHPLRGGAARIAAIVAALVLSSPASAYDVPLAGSVYYLQTGGPTAGLGIGDWYTDTTVAGTGAGNHYYGIVIPCTWPAATPIHVDLFSPELHTAGSLIDELRGAGTLNTVFEIYAPGTVVPPPPPYNVPLPLAAGSLLQTVYAPVATADNYVRFYTIPAPVACGTYILRTATQGDDDNGWRFRVGSDNDGNPNNAPPAGSDPGIAVTQIYGTLQHGPGSPNPSCISLYEYVAAGPTTTFHNFDLDGGATVTYFPPNGAPITGTVSGNGVWNNGGTATVRVGDTVAVAANQIGFWRIETCATPNNQFIQEASTLRGALFSLPLGSTVTKTDGVTVAQPGGYLQYTITFTNNSIPTGAVAANVVIRDTIPTNTTFDTASVVAPFTGSCSFSVGVVTCNVTQNVAAGASGSVLVGVLVNDPAAGATVVNNATLDYTDILGSAYPQERASDTDQLPSLKLVKTSANPGDTGDGPQAGDVITYTLTVSNPSATRQTGLVVNDPVPAGSTYVANSTTATGFQIKTFADTFVNNGFYTGSTGTDVWAGNWLEVNEADGAGAGSESVTGNALRVGDDDLGGGEGVTRQANLAITGGAACAATFAFDFRQIGLDNNESVAVSISGNGAGGPFAPLETFTNASPGTFTARSYNVTAQIAANTVVRFLSNGNLEGGEYLEVDNVVLENKCASVKDNIPVGVNQDLASGVPFTLVQATDNFDLDPGGSMTVTFRVNVTVTGPIFNIATATSAQDADPAEGAVRDIAATRASVAGVRTGGGLVEFATVWQRGTAGFNVYAASSALRRAQKVRINSTFIPSPRPDSMTPILYRVEAETTSPFLWIEEVEVGADSGRMMGPFAKGDENLRRQFDRIELRLSGQPGEERGESRSLRKPRAPRVRSLHGPRRAAMRLAATGVKIEIARAGLIQLSWNDLTSAGLPPRFARDADRLKVTTAGERVPFTSNPNGLSFIARDLSTDHTANNVYVITWNGVPLMKAPLSPQAPPPAPGYERIEKNGIYYQAAPREADPWLWDIFAAGDPWPASWDPTQGDFDLPGYAPPGGSVPVKIGLVGRTESDHHVEASINGVLVGSLDFNGMGTAFLTGSIDASSLRASGNHLTLAYSSPGPPYSAWLYLSHLDLGLTLPPPSGEVLRISSYDPDLPRLTRADYLIVTHLDFEVQAGRVATLKNAAGRSAVVVDVERAYDRFTAGIPDASAVQALIAEAGRASAVLLIGDDTDDPADNWGQGERVLVPSAISYDTFTGRLASENLYADRDRDGSPDVAIGRFPVKNAAEADAMVDKIENAESLLLPNQGRHVIAVDNQGINDFAFRAAGRQIESMLSGSTTFADVSLGASVARDTLLAGLDQGALTTTWVGHAAPDRWADEAIFVSDDAVALTDARQGTLLLNWSCLSADYRYLGGPAVNEAMVLVPRGGAVASFGPTGISEPTLQRELYLRLYPRLLAGQSLGEAAREAKAEMLAAFPGEREFLHGWVLLGDPDVRLPR